MNTEELTMLLARIQVLDNRQVDELTIQAWSPLMKHVDYSDAVEAVNEHFRSATAYLQPAHVISGVKAIRGRRDVEEARHRALNPAPVRVGVPMPADYWDIVEANKRHD